MTTATNETTIQPIAGKFQSQIQNAKAFAKRRPWAVGTLLAILSIATINTLRGRG